MRIAFILLLLAAALAQAWIDWQATIGEGYAYRLTSIRGALEAAWPERTAEVIARIEASRVSWLWDPLGAAVTAVPLALALAGLAALLWLTRRRASRLF
jgi:hypothetical protein